MRIVIVDHHPLYREGMVYLFGLEPDLTIVGDGTCAEDAVRLVSTLLPDIVILDVDIPGGGLNALQEIRSLAPTTSAILLTGSDDESTMLAAMKSGARGYVLNTISTQQLVSIVREVYGGASYVSHQLMMRVMINVANSRSAGVTSRLGILSEREREILAMVSVGSSNRQIAVAFNRSEAVIKNYMSIIMKKLQVTNRVQAARLMNQEA